jgi:hypothetical protein
LAPLMWALDLKNEGPAPEPGLDIDDDTLE